MYQASSASLSICGLSVFFWPVICEFFQECFPSSVIKTINALFWIIYSKFSKDALEKRKENCEKSTKTLFSSLSPNYVHTFQCMLVAGPVVLHIRDFLCIGRPSLVLVDFYREYTFLTAFILPTNILCFVLGRFWWEWLVMFVKFQM